MEAFVIKVGKSLHRKMPVFINEVNRFKGVSVIVYAFEKTLYNHTWETILPKDTNSKYLNLTVTNYL